MAGIVGTIEHYLAAPVRFAANAGSSLLRSTIGIAVFHTAVHLANKELGESNFRKWMQSPYKDPPYFSTNTRIYKMFAKIVREKFCFLKILPINHFIETRENRGYTLATANIAAEIAFPLITAENIQYAGSLALRTAKTVADATHFANSETHLGIDNKTAFLLALRAPDAPDQIVPNSELFLKEAKEKTIKNIQKLLNRYEEAYSKSGAETWIDRLTFWFISIFIGHFGASAIDQVYDTELPEMLRLKLQEYEINLTPAQIAPLQAYDAAYGKLGLWYALSEITEGLCSLQPANLTQTWQDFTHDPATEGITQFAADKIMDKVREQIDVISPSLSQKAINLADLSSPEQRRVFLGELDINSLVDTTLPNIQAVFTRPTNQPKST